MSGEHRADDLQDLVRQLHAELKQEQRITAMLRATLAEHAACRHCGRTNLTPEQVGAVVKRAIFAEGLR